jgi:hypothetical protein
MTKRELAIRQIDIQHKMQSAGFNLVTCGHCGSPMLHEIGDETLECLCGREMDLSDCPDYWYEGVQDSAEFNED